MEEALSNSIVLNDQGKEEIGSAARWAKFLAILGFVFSGLIIVMGLIIGPIISGISALSGSESILSAFPTAIFIVFYLALGILYFIPCWFLYKFADNTDKALRRNSTELFTESMINLKRMFKFVGIFTIVILALYLLAIIGVAIGASIGVLA